MADPLRRAREWFHHRRYGKVGCFGPKCGAAIQAVADRIRACPHDRKHDAPAAWPYGDYWRRAGAAVQHCPDCGVTIVHPKGVDLCTPYCDAPCSAECEADRD